MSKATLTMVLSLLGSFWVASFIAHDKFVSFSSNIEFAPDFKVTYRCSNYKQLEGLSMEQSGELVTVNYGGLGRRRGLRNFTCLDK